MLMRGCGGRHCLRRLLPSFLPCSSFSSQRSPPLPLSVFSPRAFAGQVGVVSGGTGSIGFAIAQQLALHGANTAVLSRSPERAQSSAERIVAACRAAYDADVGGRRTTGWTAPRVLGLQCDVTDSEQVAAAMRAAHHELGGLSCLVCAHGLSIDALALRLQDADLASTLLTNTSGTVFLARAALRLMLPQRSGSILSVSSIVARTGNVGQLAYATSKAALVGMTRALSREVSSSGVRINVLEAGWVQGGMSDRAEAAGGAVARVAMDERLGRKGWLGRKAAVDEVAAVALFLSSHAASYVQGAVIRVDGGLQL